MRKMKIKMRFFFFKLEKDSLAIKNAAYILATPTSLYQPGGTLAKGT